MTLDLIVHTTEFLHSETGKTELAIINEIHDYIEKQKTLHPQRKEKTSVREYLIREIQKMHNGNKIKHLGNVLKYVQSETKQTYLEAIIDIQNYIDHHQNQHPHRSEMGIVNQYIIDIINKKINEEK